MTEIIRIAKNIFFFLVAKWQIVVSAIIVLFVVVFVYKACNKPPKLDEKQIQKAEQAVKERNDEVLKEILADSDTRLDNIDSNIKQAEERTREAKKNYSDWTADELAAEIERRKQ